MKRGDLTQRAKRSDCRKIILYCYRKKNVLPYCQKILYINPMKIVQILKYCKQICSDRIKHNGRLIVDTKGIFPIFFRSESPRIQSRVKSLLMEQSHDIGRFRYETTPSYLCSIVEAGRQEQNDAFCAHARRDADFECRISIIESFCRRGSGQDLRVNSIVPLFVKNYNDQSPELTGRLTWAKTRKPGRKEVIKICSCARIPFHTTVAN